MKYLLFLGLFSSNLLFATEDLNFDELFSDSPSQSPKVFKVDKNEYEDAIDANENKFDNLNRKQRKQINKFAEFISENTKGISGFCYSIKNEDSKNNCIANSKREVGFCHSIKSNDLKNSCIATVRNEIGFCHSINSENYKNNCIAIVNNSIGFCHSIKNEDLKNSCIATVKKEIVFCHSIKSYDTKNSCLSNFK